MVTVAAMAHMIAGHVGDKLKEMKLGRENAVLLGEVGDDVGAASGSGQMSWITSLLW